MENALTHSLNGMFELGIIACLEAEMGRSRLHRFDPERVVYRDLLARIVRERIDGAEVGYVVRYYLS